MTAFLRPPALAVWLLKRLGRDSLLGDLCEDFQQRRSPLWFWRQTVLAFTLACLQDIRAHKWQAARAILTYAFSGYVIQQSLYLTVGNLYTPLVRAHPEFGWGLFLLFGVVIPSFLQGYLVARLHRPYPVPMVVAVIIAVLLAQVPEFARRSDNAFDDARYVSALFDFMNAAAVYVISLLAGALIVRPPNDAPAGAAS